MLTAAKFGVLMTMLVACAVAQQPAASTTAEPSTVPLKWHNFVGETFSPMGLGSGLFNAGFSQATNSDPKYGQGWGPFAQRFGASYADLVSQNFFGDFMLASAFHEDPRYVRRGPGHSFWSRAGYAISRAVIIRRDSGGDTFNWSNVLGTGMSAGLSNAYYPPASSTGAATALHFATSIGGAGFANLFPEFWPDFHGWVKRKFSR